ncbi:rhodanese-like domain-containing protein [Erwiniaceae bacterium BAC15a-03b]|uniref:Rhodanese-like domain-containing protein n=1 Tax=Winslowiella arboricola TaxID=2978220 RepID=A0A9J6PN21_9GAMM|nr:rhodanese-like domain-containing protein [Winslowiella arboricola]MCU5772805.1 rhodanese-like domain-containing protein [Winslowiella arboricola]MCU5777109.1 rhodanese-like domain-containing protein [Winslowiella arboricola]
MSSLSSALAFPPPPAADSAEWLRQKLAYYADAWDLAEDLARGIEDIVVIDARSPEAYRRAHICGAISFPHRLMSAESLASLDRSKVYITYCDGIGCNGSTKGAWKLATAGLQVKELIGGLDFWQRDNHPLATGDEPGSWPQATTLNDCGC